MRYPASLLALLLISTVAWGQDVSHFKRAEIPLEEWRMGELARVLEFRCDYQLAKFTTEALLVAEYYEGGKRVGTFRLSRFMFDSGRQSTTGTLSVGWHYDTGNLVSVMDDGKRCWSSSVSVHLEGFSPLDACYFADSLPEKRKANNGRGNMDFALYPVIGLCGQRSSQIAYPEKPDAQSFLQACTRAHAKTAVIIYLYPSENGEEPALRFTNER